ncbi:DUF4400 domain-containing protein [Massilia sp. CMS3.1]|uniref:DUF4400 domain-containing protein n=1 Tax=Massilia sp. CMS3.1 TaxID=3373083 RepID=UPI003EE57998
MIRFVSTASLLALLVLVLYLPSACPPQRFFDQLRIEARLNAEFWGTDHATRILARTLDFQTTTSKVSPVPSMNQAPSPSGVDAAVASEMAQVNHRLFNNPYFRSIDALLVLATYRLSALVEWFPVLLVLIVTILIDGFLVRLVRSKEFIQHKPEMFALSACAAIMAACATVLAFVLPVTIHPLALPFVPMAISIFVSRAVANFHRRG